MSQNLGSQARRAVPRVDCRNKDAGRNVNDPNSAQSRRKKEVRRFGVEFAGVIIV